MPKRSPGMSATTGPQDYIRVARNAVEPLQKRTLTGLISRSRFYWTPDQVLASLVSGARLASDGDPDRALAALKAKTPLDVELNIASYIINNRAGRTEAARSCRVLVDEGIHALHVAGSECVRRNNPAVGVPLLLRAATALPFIIRSGSRAPGVVLCDLATAFQDLTEFATADKIYEHALASCPSGNADLQFQRSVILSNLGAMRITEGRFNDASRLFKESLAIVDQHTDAHPSERIAALVNAGHSERLRGKARSARDLLEEARRLGKQGGQTGSANYSRALLHLADLDIEAGDETAAILRWREIRRVARRTGSVRLQAEAWSTQADYLAKSGRLEAARRCLMKACRLLDDGPSDEGDERVEVRQLLADVARRQEKFREATRWSQGALDIGRQVFGNEWIGNVDTIRTQARIAWDIKDHESCLRLRLSALELLREIVPKDHPRRLMLEGEIAEAYASNGKRGIAQRRLRACMREEARLMSRLIDRESSIFELPEMRMTRHQLELYIILILEGRPPSPQRLRDLMDLVLSFRGLAAESWRKSGSDPDGPLEMLDPLAPASDVGVAVTETVLRNNARERILLIDNGMRTMMHRLGPASQLELALKEWSRDRGKATRPALLELTDTILASIGAATRLVWLADSGLAIHPIAALPLRDGRAVADLFVVTQPRNAYVLRRRSQNVGSDRSLLVGISDFGDEADLRPLPGVADEIRRLANLMVSANPVILEGMHATRAAVLEALRGRPRIVHIATHGRVAGSGGRNSQIRARLALNGHHDHLAGTALVMAADPDATQPDLLTARDLTGLDLSSVKLVVLAACDSGVASSDASEGILGFQAALHAAGVETVVTSLWPLIDLSTVQLVHRLHSEVASGALPAEALRIAQLTTRQQWAGIRHWGGWVVSGPLGGKIQFEDRGQTDVRSVDEAGLATTEVAG